MKRILCIALTLGLFTAASAQYTKAQILQLAANHVKSFLGDNLSEYAKQSEEVRYSYYDKDGTLQYMTMTGENSMVTGNVYRIYVPYYFAFEYPNYQDTFIHGNFNIAFDPMLQIVAKPDFSFIPDFVWKAKKNDFIGRDRAKEIAFKHGMASDQILSSSLIHAKTGEFVYMFEFMNKETPPMLSELWLINAQTGEFMAHESGQKAIELLLSTAVVRPTEQH